MEPAIAISLVLLVIGATGFCLEVSNEIWRKMGSIKMIALVKCAGGCGHLCDGEDGLCQSCLDELMSPELSWQQKSSDNASTSSEPKLLPAPTGNNHAAVKSA